MHVLIDESISRKIANCRLGYVVVKELEVKGTVPSLVQQFSALQQQVSKQYNLEELPALPQIIAVRSMFRKLHFDPGRYRPASEAMVRRLLKDQQLYFVNSAVDVNNYCSINFLLPFGLYDYDKIQGDVVYHLAQEGTYENIAGHTVSTNNKPFLTDNLGVFGNPCSDSRRTAVSLYTKNLLSVVYPDEMVSDEQLRKILVFTGNMLTRYNAGKVIQTEIIRT